MNLLRMKTQDSPRVLLSRICVSRTGDYINLEQRITKKWGGGRVGYYAFDLI